MNHYETLGVPVGAAAATIRQAYLRSARRYHPDYHVADDDGTRAANARQMQVINEAWAVLGDEAARRRYDLSLQAPVATAPSRPPAERMRPNRDPVPPAGKPWTPRRDDDGWQRNFKAWAAEDERLAPDEPGARRHRGALAVVPVALFVLAVVGAFLGLVLTSRPLLAAGFVAGAVSAGLFVVLPIYEMSRSRHRS